MLQPGEARNVCHLTKAHANKHCLIICLCCSTASLILKVSIHAHVSTEAAQTTPKPPVRGGLTWVKRAPYGREGPHMGVKGPQRSEKGP